MAKTQQYHAQAGGLGVPEKDASAERTQALTERTLALVPRAKYPHCSARARDGLVSLPPLHSLTHLLHRFRRSLPLISKSSKLTRPSMQPAGAPKKMMAHPARISSLALLARLEPSLRFRFSLIALGRGDKKAARLRPAKTSNTARGVAYRRGPKQ
jgi:hypothetical protein